jgi:DNA invertase Pin-like site-specific DNA recombinase
VLIGEAGCLPPGRYSHSNSNHLFVDKASGAKDDRPGLKECLAYLREGNCLTVWKLDRLGRSLPHLLSIVTERKGRDRV